MVIVAPQYRRGHWIHSPMLMLWPSSVPVSMSRNSTNLNRPGESGDSVAWEGWSHVRCYVEEVPGRAA